MIYRSPEAVITLKQGVGRLIRDVTDRGAVIICDNRLVMRNYGETFLKSLPNSTRTRDLNKVVQFLQNEKWINNEKYHLISTLILQQKPVQLHFGIKAKNTFR